MKRYQAKTVIKEHYKLGESPFYDERTGMLSFVDIITGTLYVVPGKNILEINEACSFDKLGGRTLELGQQMGSAVPMKDEGEYLLAGTDGLYRTCKGELLKVLDTTRLYTEVQRSNDVKCDPKGRIFFGSSVYVDGAEASGNLFRYDHGEVKVLQKDTRISNGMGWSRDRKKYYFSDSLFYSVFEYDYDYATGDISNRKELFSLGNDTPDGMCIDSEDNLWVAIWGGHRIEQRSTKTGELLAVVDVPAQNVTSCCFFGPNKNMLFITSSGDGLSGAEDGCIFICEVDATGTPTDFCEV